MIFFENGLLDLYTIGAITTFTGGFIVYYLENWCKPTKNEVLVITLISLFPFLNLILGACLWISLLATIVASLLAIVCAIIYFVIIKPINELVKIEIENDKNKIK